MMLSRNDTPGRRNKGWIERVWSDPERGLALVVKGGRGGVCPGGRGPAGRMLGQ